MLAECLPSLIQIEVKLNELEEFLKELQCSNVLRENEGSYLKTVEVFGKRVIRQVSPPKLQKLTIVENSFLLKRIYDCSTYEET